MDLQENAHPVGTGTSVRDAADAIVGLLDSPSDGGESEGGEDQQEAAEDQSAEQVDQGGEVEEGSQEASEAETEQDAESADEGATDASEVALPETLDGLAEAIGLDPLDLHALKLSVKVNGATENLPLAEVVKSYQLEADARQKARDLAEQQRAHETAVSEAQQEWQRRFEAIDALTQQLQAQLEGQAPDLERILREEGSEAYWAAKAEYDVKAGALKKAEEARNQAKSEADRRGQEQAQRYFAEQQRRARELIPDLYDEKKGPALKGQMKSYLARKGFSEQDVQGVADARIMDVIYDAMRYHDLQKSKPGVTKKLKALPKVMKPGAAREPGEGAQQKHVAKVHRLRKTGTTRDAAAVFEGLL